MSKLSNYRKNSAEFLQMKKNKTLNSLCFSSASDKDSLYEFHPDSVDASQGIYASGSLHFKLQEV